MPGTNLEIKKKECFTLLKNHPFLPTPLKFPSLSNLLSPYYSKTGKKLPHPTQNHPFTTTNPKISFSAQLPKIKKKKSNFSLESPFPQHLP